MKPLDLLTAIGFFFACAHIIGCGRSSQAPHEALQTPPLCLKDSDHDGIPDAAEVLSFEDRQNFRRRFATFAEMQFYELSNNWNAEQQDCAGLVRFAWREALRRHQPWFRNVGSERLLLGISFALAFGSHSPYRHCSPHNLRLIARSPQMDALFTRLLVVHLQHVINGLKALYLYEALAPDLRSYDWQQSPLGEKLFRTDLGTFKESDLYNAKFSEFADAQTLMNFNCGFIGRDRRRAQTGDLLFFRQLSRTQKFSYHSMIFLGNAQLDAEGASDWVVYHSGPGNGIVKKARLAMLDQYPNPRWRPIGNNPNFLGFFRLKILE